MRTCPDRSWACVPDLMVPLLHSNSTSTTIVPESGAASIYFQSFCVCTVRIDDIAGSRGRESNKERGPRRALHPFQMLPTFAPEPFREIIMLPLSTWALRNSHHPLVAEHVGMLVVAAWTDSLPCSPLLDQNLVTRL